MKFSILSVTICAIALTTCSAIAQNGAPNQAAQTLALPGGASLLPNDLSTVKSYGQGAQTFEALTVPVQGQNFREALRLSTLSTPENYWDYGSTIPLIAPVKKGDVLWVSLWARRLTSVKESGEAQFELAFLQQVNGQEVRPLERIVSFGSGWTQFTIPFTVQNDAPVGQASLGFRFGYGRQSVEIGGFQLLNYGPNVKLTDLPLTRIRYDGWAADAPWRKAAAERIEKYRKGDMTIRVVDDQGQPVSGAQVQVRMKRHSFAWGTNVSDERINDQTDPNNERYRRTIEKYFNKVVIGNSLKWVLWIRPEHRESALKSLSWFATRNIPVRGHVLVWPAWQDLPSELFTEEAKKDPAAMRKLIADHIAEEASTLRGRVTEWDVANETSLHKDLFNVLGNSAMADWFKQTRAADPNVKLFYNDFTMFDAGKGSDHVYDTVKGMQERGVPIDGIGEQAHFGSSPKGIPDVLAKFDKFAKLGLPIQITEFDIDSDDAGLQADYMRDFTTAAFSHPSVMGVMQWGFWESGHWIPRAALWDKNWNLRPHGKVWVDLVTKTWWTNADGTLNPQGIYKTRGFYGDYEVTISKDGKSQSAQVRLSPQNGGLTMLFR